MSNVAEALASEIRRVTELRAIYVGLAKVPGVNVAPVLFMIDRALDAAVTAAGIDDATVQIPALQDLRGFES